MSPPHTTADPAAQPRAGTRAHVWLIGCVWAALALGLFTGPGPIVSGDSGGYRVRNWQIVIDSLMGNWVRGWPIVVTFQLLGSTRAIEIFQFAAYGVAITIFVLSLARVFQRSWIYLAVSVPSCLLLVTGALLFFQYQVLSEGLTLSMTVLALAFLLSAYIQRRDAAFAAFLVFAALSGIVKPFLLVVWIAAALPYVLWVNAEHPETRRLRWRPAAALLLTLLVAGVWVTRSLDYRHHFRSYELDAIGLLASNITPDNEAFRHAMDEAGVPRCLDMSRPFAATEVEVFRRLNAVRARCPEANRWAREHFTEEYARFLLEHPGFAITQLKRLFPFSLAAPSLVEPSSVVVPLPVQWLLLGTVSPSIDRLTDKYPARPTNVTYIDLLPIELLATNALLAWAIARRRRRGPDDDGTLANRYAALQLALVLAADIALACALVQTLIQPDSALEMFRIGIEVNTIARVSVFVGLGLALELWLRRGAGCAAEATA